MNATLRPLLGQLFELGCIRFGEYTLKSGIKSPVYIDLRLLPSSPDALQTVARLMAEVADGLKFDRIGAVPTAGLPLGTALCLEMRKPLIYPRSEKDHGTKKRVEGIYNPGNVVLLIDDLITLGHSKMEAIQTLESAGLTVRDILVFVDREQGGVQDMAERGYKLHSVLTLRDWVEALRQQGEISISRCNEVLEYLEKG